MPEIIQLMRDMVDLQGLSTSTGLHFVPTPDKTVHEMLAPFREEVERLEKNPDLRVERVVLTDEGARVAQELPGWRMLVKG
jgi:hypothetical protein